MSAHNLPYLLGALWGVAGYFFLMAAKSHVDSWLRRRPGHWHKGAAR